MHKSTLLLITLLCTISLLRPVKVNANVAAGDIIYQWYSDSTYRFIVKLYSDCSGSAAPATIPLCFHNTCNSSQSFSITLSQLSSPVNTIIGCSSMKNQCDSPQSALPGYQEILYTATGVLPTRCKDWHIYTYVNYRSGGNNILNTTSTPFYLDARFNNTGTLNANSSPYASEIPLFYAYKGRYVFYNSLFSDPDGDSLITELTDPMTNVNSCVDTVPAKISYVSAFPSINKIVNPFQTNNTFSLNSSSGVMHANPAQTGKQTIAIKINEYRKGVLIGNYTREIQLVVFDNPPPEPAFYAPDTVFGCVGYPVSFSWSFKSANPSAYLIPGDDHKFYPGSTVVYTGIGTDSVRGTFNGAVTKSFLTGLNAMGVWVKDSTCDPPGIIQTYNYGVLISQQSPVTTIRDTTRCNGDTTILYTNDGSVNTWSMLPGGTPGSLCASCVPAEVHPADTSTYVVTSAATKWCPVTTDTVTINAITALTRPSVNVTVTPGTTVTDGTPVTFLATQTNCTASGYQWYINGIKIPGARFRAFSTSTLKDANIVTCLLTCADTCPRPKDTMSNPITIHITAGIEHAIPGKTINIYPNPNNGSFIIKGHIAGNSCNIYVINTLGQTVYSNILSVHDTEITANIKLDVPAGIYLLKLNNESYRFIVNNKQE